MKEKNNVANISDHRTAKKSKVARTDLYFNICDSINHSPFAELGNFNRKFIVIEPEKGIRKVLEVNELEECSYVDNDAVINEILKFVHTNKKCIGKDAWKWEVDVAKKCFEFWLRQAPVIEQPEIFRWRDDPGLCMTRLKWDYDPFGETPLINEIFTRMVENRQAAIDFIGSIFVKGSYRQQYLYLYSPQGNDGKGTLCSILLDALGDAGKMLSCPLGPKGGLEDKYWTGDLEGCRLGVIDDLDRRDMVTSGFWKQVTGNDKIRIHNKYDKPYTGRLDTKFIITSNKLPFAKSTRSEKRRCILVPMATADIKMNRTEYEQKVKAEAGSFISACIYSYLTNYPNHGAIECTYEEYDDLAEENNFRFQSVFDRYFFEDQDASCSADSAYKRVTEWHGWSNYQYGEFRDWLINVRKFRCERKRDGEKRINMFHGFKIKQTDDSVNGHPWSGTGLGQNDL